MRKIMKVFLIILGTLVIFLADGMRPELRNDYVQTSASPVSEDDLAQGITAVLERNLTDLHESMQDRLPIGWPVDGDTWVITSEFGYRINPVNRRGLFHDGIDIKARWWQPVRSTAGGRVIFSGWRGGYGRTVIVDHGVYQTLYAHLHRRKVRRGSYVKKGSIIGVAGASGRATGPHLHYEVLKNKLHLNPEHFL